MTILITLITMLAIAFSAKLAGNLVAKVGLPPLIGMMLLGMLAGPSLLNIVPAQVQIIAPTVKDMALVIVLFIAGLGINLEALKSIGRPAVLLSLLPALLEGFCIAVLSMHFLGFTFIQGGILGFIIAAVSPAVLIPSMLSLIEEKRGTNKSIPQMLLVGASADDTVAITFFTMFLNMQLALTGGGSVSVGRSLGVIPLSIIAGIGIAWLFSFAWKKMTGFLGAIHVEITGEKTVNEASTSNKSTLQTILLTACMFGFRWIEQTFHLSWFNSLLMIMCIGFFTRHLMPSLAKSVREKLQIVWEYGKLYLFFFVGMAINPTLVGSYFLVAVAMLLISLTIRSIGVYLSLIGTNLTVKEKLFCVVAYLPKATVQSAKAGVPLQNAVAGGEIIQAIAITSVLITAPIGAIGIKILAPKCLDEN